MPDKFTYRSDEKELLDKSNINRGLLNKNLRELDILNRTTGGQAISLKGIKQLITDHDKIYHVVDLGCGSGDALKAIADWTRLNNYSVRLTGVDRNVHAIDYLKIHYVNYPEITGITADYRDYLNKNEFIDIVHCSLFCHHLNDDELLRLFISGNMLKPVLLSTICSGIGWHIIAPGFLHGLNGTALAKNDGPISVLRGFKSGELTGLLAKANIRNYSIQKEWAFRFLIVGKTETHEAIGQ